MLRLTKKMAVKRTGVFTLDTVQTQAQEEIGRDKR